MAFCTNCGQELSNDAKFCPSCGVATQKETSGNERKTIYDGEIHKCPNCGEVLKSFESFCPSCNFELRGKESSSTVAEFVKKCELLDKKKSILLIKKKQKLKGNALLPVEEEKIALISNFIIPNTREDIFEFLILSSTNVLKKASSDASKHEQYLHNEMKKAWKIKFEQAYEKAKKCLLDENDLIEIERYYEKTIIVPRRRRVCIIVLISILVISFYGIMAAVITCGAMEETKANRDPNAIEISISYDDVKGMPYEEAVEFFEEKGFTNIETVKDSGFNIFGMSGTVKKVTVDGDSSFSADDKAYKDSTIVIFYYE